MFVGIEWTVTSQRLLLKMHIRIFHMIIKRIKLWPISKLSELTFCWTNINQNMHHWFMCFMAKFLFPVKKFPWGLLPYLAPKRNPSFTLPHQPETVDYSKLNLSHWNPRLSEDLLSTTRERSEIKDCTLHRVTNPPL